MRPPRCSQCGQPLTFERAGVRLTPLKAAIFDLIQAAGEIGVSSQEILQQAFRERHVAGADIVKMHVHQINDLLEATDFIIRSDRRKWTLERREVRAIA
jgi:hypothetical protein